MAVRNFRIRRFFAELRRRRVLRDAGLYFIAAWLTMQVADVLSVPLQFSDSTIRLILYFLIGLFPGALIFAWFYDITAQGIIHVDDARERGSPVPLNTVDYAVFSAAGLIIVIALIWLFGNADKQEKTQVAQDVDMPTWEIPDEPSIAVLPFENLSEDSSQDYFCDALTIDITTDLSKFKNLFVIGSHSVFSFKGKTMVAQELSRQLGVRYLLSGSVQKGLSRIRINVQLVDAITGRNLWADRYDRQYRDLFSVQNDLIDSIVASLALNISVEERDRATHKEAANLEARDYYLRGVAAQPCRSSNECRDNFEKAYELDPNHARTLGWLSYVLHKGWKAGWEGYTDDDLDRAFELAKKAVKLDPNDYQSHWSLAVIYLGKRDHQKGMESYARALHLNDNDPDLLVEMAEQFVYSGQYEEAIAQIRMGMRLNPLYPDWYRDDLGWVLYMITEYEQSIDVLSKMSELPADARLLMAANYAQLGKPKLASAQIYKVLAIRPDWTITKEREAEFFRDQQGEDHWLDGLRKAGLPE